MHLERKTLVKVPEVTAIFWVVKVLTTGMGETTSDFWIHREGVTNTTGLIAVVLIAAAILAVALAMQFAADRYVAPIYWFAVLMVAITGTMAADGVHVELGVSYAELDRVPLGGARGAVRRVVPGRGHAVDP